jgi:thymidylate synthase
MKYDISPRNFHDEYHAVLSELVSLADDEPPEPNRTEQKSWRLFGVTLRHDFLFGFPLLWSKKIDMRNVAEELFWFLRGSTDEQELRDAKVNIWKEWRRTPTDPDLGPIYGHQWRHCGYGYEHGGVDQVRYVLDELEANPSSRRAVVNCWRPDELELMALPPCHYAWQILRDKHDGLHMIVTMRSGDIFLGVPYNMASYSLLLLMFAKALGCTARTITLNIGDSHLYEAARDAAQAQIEYFNDPARIPGLPQVSLVRGRDFYARGLSSASGSLAFKWHEEQFQLNGYVPGPFLGVKVAV